MPFSSAAFTKAARAHGMSGENKRIRTLRQNVFCHRSQIVKALKAERFYIKIGCKGSGWVAKP
ncbi:hypothetical protein [Neisseria weixii]|uniref:hypothetical protein n=1 Tax=Neisseria weixii TaxID=1853276 RepID=UPI0018F68E25|nr:hypothetical protein [Neisseria weixii]